MSSVTSALDSRLERSGSAPAAQPERSFAGALHQFEFGVEVGLRDRLSRM